jgi:hypothetical protein
LKCLAARSHPTPTARVQEPTQACHAPLAKQ